MNSGSLVQYTLPVSARSAPSKKLRPSLPPEGSLNAAQVLALLRRHGGREYLATVYFGAQEKGEYRLTARGERLRAQGPSGVVTELDAESFAEMFRRYHFAGLQASGVLTDLGPLFG